MAWITDTRKVPTIHTYEKACAIEEKIKPIRGGTTKPLCDRRKQHLNIRKEPSTGNVIIQFHRTDVITYKPDGEIVVGVFGWTTPSTIAVLDAVLYPASVQNYKGKAWIRCGCEKFAAGYLPIPRDTGLVFTAGNTVFYDAPLLYCPNPQYPVTHTINRKKFNDARKEFKSFLTYARGMIKLRGDEGFEFETVAQPSGGTLFRVITELSKSADPEEQYRALLHAMPTVRWSWRRGTGVRVCTVAQFLAHFDKLLLKAHSDTLLDRKVVTSGALVFDRYAKYTRDKTLDSAT